ncbi:D-alanine--D-alanine ligase [Campylobacter canadensis]|uniref:D-alanine--D-alanine ligase n=1 Tax=Campylobacter canadensis TaxID=449520 RepID=UPI0015529467|nr:D-alanine--D-alanine ligase [Campylobacter canadensis]MBZ7994316.1 D-alanine--D-alanine ligase [Campylobacter canadensis]MBZ7996012.1 D-alanine--D-alanine ligase [Campylobacter canadensis]MBZ7999648.1 D-alanine--D-alanine ligase [Campylobacter canadensis]MBZ8001443.1 D-alanine--D-alanine ligase [Campylobacter canadensis]MBZ8003982.1 D-alanine--D-alanine ligase [Campylobacter canadensis]
MKKAIIFGANSYEHEISIVSAITLSNILEDVKFIYVDFEHNFYLIDKKNMNAQFFAKKDFKKQKRIYISNGGFYEKSLFSQNKIDIDLIINTIHGKIGEDGTMAALLDFFNIKYIGPRINASSISIDKHLTKLYANEVGVKSLKYYLNPTSTQGLEFPLILKPANLGSSIGIAIANNSSEFAYALDSAKEYDDKIIAEPYFENIQEINLAGYFDGEKIVFSKFEEPKKNGHLDFSQKYLVFKQKEIQEVKLSEEIQNKLKDAFSKIYMPLFKGALIRCDFFIKDNEIFLNEINPNPGSYANYLFDDFEKELNSLANSIKNNENIKENYSFLQKIVQAK